MLSGLAIVIYVLRGEKKVKKIGEACRMFTPVVL